LFRGFVFQRLISGLGQGTAQLITAAFFLLTHLNNPGMTGVIKVMASVNIFLASILFGLAFIQTKSLAMPLGLHWMANWMQGGVLGFGVSGTQQLGLLQPVFGEAPAWLTGGQFGLEASLPGLVCVVVTLLLLNTWKPFM
jgi:membrane protease YdiL (CAAX protease family)